MTPPSILFVITRSDAIGGAHIHVRDMASALRQLGVDARVAVGGDGPYLEQLQARQIPVIRLHHLVRPIRPLAELRAYRELLGVLREHRPVLVSTHSSKAGLLGRMACRRLKLPVVFTAHGWAFTDGVSAFTATIYRNAEKFAGPMANRIITVSEFDRRIALKADVGQAEKLRAVHNGMPALQAPALPARAAESPLRLVMTARLDEQKDHRTLLLALGMLRDVDWCLDLIGDGPLLSTLRQLAEQLQIADRIRFLGLRNDVAELLSRSDVFLLVSNWEGFPRSILEGMRAGLPVIATDVAGVSESVAEGRTGFLVPRSNAEVLANRIRQLLTDATLRASMGQAGRERFEQEFTFAQMFQRTLAVYDEVMVERGLATRFLSLLGQSPS
ncbi:MAG: glycosyltransferase family 4 protein [Pseudomonadota bacterium]